MKPSPQTPGASLPTWSLRGAPLPKLSLRDAPWRRGNPAQGRTRKLCLVIILAVTLPRTGHCADAALSERVALATAYVKAAGADAEIAIWINANTKLYADALLKQARNPPADAEFRVMAMIRPDISAALPNIEEQKIQTIAKSLTLPEIHAALDFALSPLGQKLVALKLTALRTEYLTVPQSSETIRKSIIAHKTELAALGVTL